MNQKFADHQKSTAFSISLIILGIILLLSIVFGILVLLKMNIIHTVVQETEDNKKQMESLLTSELQQLQQSRKISEYLKRDRIVWNPIVSELLNNIPENVYITSFTGNNSGKITVQCITTTVDKVVSTINILSRSTILKNMFVSSLSLGMSSDNNTVITFPMTFELSKK